MDPASQVVIFWLQSAALWVLFAFLTRNYALERLRENLFSIRDELFDEIADGDQEFRSSDYLHLRSYVNQVIRRGHMITPSRAALYEVLVRFPGVTGGVTPQEMRAQVNEQIEWLKSAKESNPRVKRVHAAVHMQLMQYYCLTSPLFLLVMLGAIGIVVCSIGVRGLRATAQLAFDKFFGADIDRGISSDGDMVAAC